MPGMMQSIRSGRGVVCPCCDEWTATRAAEKRQWMREADDERAEYEYMLKRAILGDIVDSLEIGFGDD
ncbi:hypothetical protein SEA_ARCHIE_3 [Mycobacterium phage Archie]|uniref:Uncharacterized protein n=1 Tax=Mycobacterium phage Archie TaxID=1718599 RepID=A0A0M4S2R6_9CAUD|nr:hypothetical protein AVU85_gp003 [Mycobacterium phage Archie]ALF00309.1 hypothetical protein SEA_ARCHIE_3 [Mycobacterium phage Archie]